MHARRLKSLLLGGAITLPLALSATWLVRVLAALANSTLYRRALVNAAVDGIIAIDEAGIVHACNPATEAIFGYRAAELVGQPVQTIIPAPFHVYYRLISSGTEVVGRHKDGTLFPMDLTSGRMQIGDQTCYIGIARDISRFKRTEADLAQARDAAERANRAKSTFLLNVSHELRTPLNHIIGYSDLLAEDLAPGSPHADDVAKIRTAGAQLQRLINGVLDLTRDERDWDDLSLARFDPATLVYELAAAASPALAARRNQLHIQIVPGCMVYADPARLRQIVAQLLDNAGKFTEDGIIQLIVQPLRDTRQPLTTFEIQDTGIGIAPDRLARIFEPFAAHDAGETQRNAGAGLGLSVAQRLARTMAGDVTLHSTPGAGTRAVLRLPASAP